MGLFACSGDVVTMECVEKVIKKDMIHPLTNQKLKEKDIIPLQRVSGCGRCKREAPITLIDFASEGRNRLRDDQRRPGGEGEAASAHVLRTEIS